MQGNFDRYEIDDIRRVDPLPVSSSVSAFLVGKDRMSHAETFIGVYKDLADAVQKVGAQTRPVNFYLANSSIF